MTLLDADAIVDRRRLRRKVTFWRVAGIAGVVVAICAVALAATPDGRSVFGARDIARIKIEGLIRSNDDRVKALDRLAKSKAPAVILHINSPGGTTAGSEQLHDALLQLKKEKPLVVVVEGLAASGGYITAIAADHIVAQSSSLVGSIGVLVQFPNVGDLLKTVGVKMEEVKSSPLKAAPNGFEPTSPEARAALESIVMDSYLWFKTLVKDRRGMDDAQLATVSDGRVFTGRQALSLKLVDELGDEKAALAWLVREKGVDPDAKISDYKLTSGVSGISLFKLASMGLELAGLDVLARQIDALGLEHSVEAAGLEGVLALWRPAPTR